MNFCGMNHEHVLDMEQNIIPESSNLVVNSLQCVGGCVKGMTDDDDGIIDDDEFFNIEQHLSPVTSDSSVDDDDPVCNNDENHTTNRQDDDENVDGCRTKRSNNNRNKNIGLEPVRMALDNIQLTIEDDINHPIHSIPGVVKIVDNVYILDDVAQDDEIYHHHHHHEVSNNSNSYNTTPHTMEESPISTYLNPIHHHVHRNSLRPIPPMSWMEQSSSSSAAVAVEPKPTPVQIMTHPNSTTDDDDNIVPELLCPILEIQDVTSPSQEPLMIRFQNGFHVRRPITDNTITSTKSNDNISDVVGLYLHPDRKRLYVTTASIYDTNMNHHHHHHRMINNSREKYPSQNTYPKIIDQPLDDTMYDEILISDIIRLEIGNRTNTTSFVIVTEHHHDDDVIISTNDITNTTTKANSKNNNNKIINHDIPGIPFVDYHTFEALCVIDREIIISSLLLLLDKLNNNTNNTNDDEIIMDVLSQNDSIDQHDIDDTNTYDWIEIGTDSGGTINKPIPCSPSLDEPFSFHMSIREEIDGEDDEQERIICSPSIETERMHNSYRVLPRHRREYGSVIHLEDISTTDSNLSRVMGEWSRRTSQSASTCLQQRSIDEFGEINDLRIDFKPSASSTQIAYNPSTNNITSLAQTVWCSGDTCALALNDIAETCTGIFELKHNDSLCAPSLGTEQRIAVEEFVTTALGTSSVVYSYLTDGADIWNSNKSASVQSIDTKDTKIPRNRASLLNAQAARLRELRNEMTFAAALKQSKEKMQFVQTVQSFDDAYTRAAGTKKLRAATEAANRLHTSPLLQSIVGRMTMHDIDGNTKSSLNNEVEVYYDSDPEDNRTRTMGKGLRNVAIHSPQRNNDEAKPNLNTEEYPKSLDEIRMDDVISPVKISKRLDEETIVEIVQAMTNERFTLMWHPTQTTHNPRRSPMCVKVWIESGVYLNDGTFLLPKLSWSKISMLSSTISSSYKNQIQPNQQHAFHTTSTTGIETTTNHQLHQQPMIETLDLLDICRIYPIQHVNRTHHPFVLVSKSFGIETQQEIYIFQTQTIEERDKIVFGLKLVVARLASLLMLRDIRAAEEFFGTISHNTTTTTAQVTMGPGTEPTWSHHIHTITGSTGVDGGTDNIPITTDPPDDDNVKKLTK